MQTSFPCLIAGLLLSCISWPAVVDAQLTQSTTYVYATKCSSWSPITANVFDTVDVTTGSCIYGQAVAGYAAGMNTCPVTNLNSDGVTAYKCQCVTQAVANGGDVAFAAMQKKATVKRRLRRAGFVFLGINVLIVLGILGSGGGGEGGGEEGATSEGFGCLLIIIFLACGYTNRDLFNPDLTPYFVGCGSQAESVGAYSIGSSWSPSVDVGTSPLLPAPGIGTEPLLPAQAPATTAASSTTVSTQELDELLDGSGFSGGIDERVTSSGNFTYTEEEGIDACSTSWFGCEDVYDGAKLAIGTIAGIVIGSICVCVCSLLWLCVAVRRCQNEQATAGTLEFYAEASKHVEVTEV